jgi:small conductance mechanosensitive channel
MNPAEAEVSDVVTKSEILYAKVVEQALDYGPKVLGAIAIFIVGFWLSNRMARLIAAALNKKNLDVTIRIYLERIVGIVLKVLVVITAAGMVGVETTSFVALLGAAGLAIGLALQGSLANFAGGILILFLRPFRVGDYIEAQGEAGTVHAIDIFNTTLHRPDNKQVIIPNGPLIGGNIVNFNASETRRIEVLVGVSYDSDIEKIEKILVKLANEDSRVLKDPEPMVGVVNFGDSSIDLTFRVWAHSEDFWPVSFDMYKKTKQVFDANGISIPFPQREVRMLGKN